VPRISSPSRSVPRIPCNIGATFSRTEFLGMFTELLTRLIRVEKGGSAGAPPLSEQAMPSPCMAGMAAAELRRGRSTSRQAIRAGRFPRRLKTSGRGRWGFRKPDEAAERPLGVDIRLAAANARSWRLEYSRMLESCLRRKAFSSVVLLQSIHFGQKLHAAPTAPADLFHGQWRKRACGGRCVRD